MRDPAFSEPRKIAGDFGFAAAAAAIRDRKFKDPEAGAGDAHLHFKIPAIGEFAHAQRKQSVAAHRAIGAHVSVTHAVKQTDQRAGGEPGEDLVAGHAARLALPRAREPITKS